MSLPCPLTLPTRYPPIPRRQTLNIVAASLHALRLWLNQPRLFAFKLRLRFQPPTEQVIAVTAAHSLPVVGLFHSFIIRLYLPVEAGNFNCESFGFS